MKPNNPFLISGYYSPEFFCDREQETVTILDALHNGRNVTLIAPRRMGKTGLIRHAFYRLKEKQPDIVTFYMDIYSTQSLGDFVRLFASTVLGQLDSVPQKALSRISQFIRSCRPVFTFDELTGVPIQKMLCCGILLMFSLLQRLKICWGTNWGRNFAGQKKKRANIESLFIPYRRFRFPKI